MCTIINCSKVNSSLLLSRRDRLPTKHLRSSKLLLFVKTWAPKAWGKKGKGNLTGRYSNSSDSFAHTSAEQAAVAAFSQQAAPWKIWDNRRSFLLESSICTINKFGVGGEAQILLCERKMLLKFNIINFVPHLYFHCLMDHQQQCARNALIAWFQKSAAFQEAQAHSLLRYTQQQVWKVC